MALYHRNEAIHNALPREILYHSVIGSFPPSHPEFIAFMKGFKLTCRTRAGGIHFNLCSVCLIYYLRSLS